MLLFVQSYDVRKGKSSEYTDFVLRTHLPSMKSLGLNVIGGFHVIVGSGPRISVVAMAEDFLDLQKVIWTQQYISLTEELQNYVQDYGSRILRSTDRIPVGGDYSIESGTWRLNQYYKISRGSEREYSDFLVNEYIPKVAELGLKVRAEWQVALGSGPRILLETVAPNITDIAQAFNTDEFKRLRRHLLINYVDSYSSRIMAPTGRVEVAFILGGMTAAL
jgi:hypothetical protein